MLALLSTAISHADRVSATVTASSPEKNGRANASASSSTASARSENRKTSSSRLLRVARGGDGFRNISELNGDFLRGARAARW